MYIYI
jgi:hypothetical protein